MSSVCYDCVEDNADMSTGNPGSGSGVTETPANCQVGMQHYYISDCDNSSRFFLIFLFENSSTDLYKNW